MPEAVSDFDLLPDNRVLRRNTIHNLILLWSIEWLLLMPKSNHKAIWESICVFWDIPKTANVFLGSDTIGETGEGRIWPESLQIQRNQLRISKL